MDVSHMREVLVLAEHLNFTTAASALYISQPTLTAQTKRVYKHLHNGVIDVALVHLRGNTNPNIARLAACIPDIRKPVM